MSAYQPTGEELARALHNVEILSAVGAFRVPRDLEIRLGEAGSSAGAESLLPQVVRLRRDGGLKHDWSQRLVRGLGHVHEGLAASYYHSERVRLIEEDVTNAAAQLELVPGETIGFGSRQLNIEYQACVLALRRTLEYLAGATAAFFKLDQSRIRKISANISDRPPVEISRVVAEYISNALHDLPRILSESGELSVRDRIVHWEAVDAGTFNVLLRPGTGELEVHLVGGGEELEFGLGRTPLLDETIRLQLDGVVTLVLGVYERLGLSPSRALPSA